MGRKHGWNDLDNYLHVALRVLEDHPFVTDHKLEIEASPAGGEISGEVFCYGDIVLDVTKHYEVRTFRNRKRARTIGYSYHARYKEGGDILRYDNVHAHPGHRTPHHKHEFQSGREIVSHIGENWPHLGEVLDELRALVWG